MNKVSDLEHMSHIWLPRIMETESLWEHSGDFKKPHVITTAKRHTSGYFKSDVFEQYPLMLNEACNNLAHLLMLRHHGILETVDRVVGPAMGAIRLADGVARHIGSITSGFRDKPCLSGFAEKEEKDGVRRMVFKRVSVEPGERVLIVENTVNTGNSVNLLIEAVELCGGIVIPIIGAIMNRSRTINRRVVSLVHLPMTQWTRNKCTLCSRGSEAIDPHPPENWKRLQGH